MRAIKLFSLFCLAAMSAVVSRAQSVNTGGAPGTYTYTINLGNGALFDVTMNGAFGTPDSNITSYAYVGTPDSSYVNDPFVVTSGNTSNGGVIDQELVLQYDSATDTNPYDNTLDYTFVEPTSFWETTGTQSFTTGDDYVYDLQGWTGQDASGTTGSFDGNVPEGANYNYYDNSGGTDPACTSCSITTTFVPSPAATPEPSSLLLLGTGLLGGAAAFRRRFM